MGAEHITSHRKGAAGAAGPTAAAAAGGQPAPIALEPAFLRGLQTVAVDEYRRNYQRFRKGKAVGAKGERPDPAANLRGSSEEEELEDMFELEGDGMRLYQEIMEFRLSYRRYRMGHAKGAKGDVGELARKLSSAAAHLLPVSGLSALLHAQMQDSFAFSGDKSTFHIHIGAGRLGLGLVLPAMVRSGVPFAVLQRPSSSWNEILQSTPDSPHLQLAINGQVVCDDMVVVRDLTELPPSEPQQANLFVLSEDPLLLHLLITTASSFSISLGPSMLDVVVPLLSKLPVVPPDGKRPSLYAAENDHNMVTELAKQLEGRVDVIHCMVDRICVDRSIEPRAIGVKCEPYEGEMVIMRRASNGLPPPFEGQFIRSPAMDAQAQYFCRRKFLMVNGTHTTLAFMTLVLRSGPEGPKGGPIGDFPLIDWDPQNAGPKYYQEIWAWAVARLLIILWEHELPVLKHAHGVSEEAELCDVLLHYAKETLKRFSSISDTTTRVLKGGVANRWETRLNSVNDFLEGFRTTPTAAMLLKKAQIRLPYIKKVVAELCSTSHPFTGLVKPQAGKVVCT